MLPNIFLKYSFWEGRGGWFGVLLVGWLGFGWGDLDFLYHSTKRNMIYILLLCDLKFCLQLTQFWDWWGFYFFLLFLLRLHLYTWNLHNAHQSFLQPWQDLLIISFFYVACSESSLRPLPLPRWGLAFVTLSFWEQ